MIVNINENKAKKHNKISLRTLFFCYLFGTIHSCIYKISINFFCPFFTTWNMNRQIYKRYNSFKCIEKLMILLTSNPICFIAEIGTFLNVVGYQITSEDYQSVNNKLTQIQWLVLFLLLMMNNLKIIILLLLFLLVHITWSFKRFYLFITW